MRIAPADLADLPTGTRDPVAIIEQQNATRLPDLVPVRIGRMLQSAFACYRGSAATMAADLAASATTGIDVMSCGDAHLANFGFYASPGRSLVLDLNDFDEAGIAPWDWDVRRLMASIHLAALDIGAAPGEAQAAVRAAAKAYRGWTHRFAEVPALERYYATLDVTTLQQQLTGDQRRSLDKATAKARTRTSAQALDRLVVTADDGRLRIIDQPPLTRHTDDADPEQLDDVWRAYLTAGGR